MGRCCHEQTIGSRFDRGLECRLDIDRIVDLER
jgi:hypothetical protein